MRKRGKMKQKVLDQIKGLIVATDPHIVDATDADIRKIVQDVQKGVRKDALAQLISFLVNQSN